MVRAIGVILLGMVVAFGSVCEKKLFSLDTDASQSTTIEEVVVDLAQTCQLTVLFEDQEARHQIKAPLGIVHLHDYTLEELLAFLLGAHNLFYSFDQAKGLLKVAYLRTKTFRIDYVNVSELKTESIKSITVGTSDAAANGSTTQTSTTSTDTTGRAGDNTDRTTITTVSEFKFWESLKRQIDAILQRDEDRHKVRSKALINKEAGIITVTGTKRQIDRVAAYIDNLIDRLHKQVMIEASIIELRYDEENTTGVNWQAFELSLKGLARKGGEAFEKSDAYELGYAFSMDGLMRFLRSYGTVRIVSNPKVMTLNNQPAVINVGDQINYRYQTGVVANYANAATATNTYEIGSVFVGLTLNIIPEVTDGGYILLRINPVISEKIESSNKSGTIDSQEQRVMPPDVNVKQLTSVVKVKDGHEVVIGGLMSKQNTRDHTKVPILGDIPILGYAFHRRLTGIKRTELIIVIRPRVVDPSKMPTIEDLLARHHKGTR